VGRRSGGRPLSQRHAVHGPIPRREVCTDALDQVRREVWNAARQAGTTTVAAELKGARYALWKNPEDLTAQ